MTTGLKTLRHVSPTTYRLMGFLGIGALYSNPAERYAQARLALEDAELELSRAQIQVDRARRLVALVDAEGQK